MSRTRINIDQTEPEGDHEMINRREFIAGLAAAGMTQRLHAAANPPEIRLGLELFSLREELKRDLPAALTRARQFGFRHVENAIPQGLSAAEFKRALVNAGLTITSMAVPYETLRDQIDNVRRNLDTLGAHWVIVAWIPHGDTFERADLERTVKDFNRWGATLARSGHAFAYHAHGVEFHPTAEGTNFDAIVKATDPGTVKFELDTFWAVWAGQNPAELLRRHPGRFRMVHVKDRRKGAKTGSRVDQVPDTDSVVAGEGVIQWGDVLAAAREQRIEDYFLEDECLCSIQQIPRSLAYLRQFNVVAG